MIDVDRALGIRWQDWGKLSVVSGRISRMVFVMLASVSATGWWGVVLIGAVLGVGA